MANLPLNPGTLASNCYPESPQTLYNEMFAKGLALAGDLTGVIISATEPDPEDRDKMWVKFSAGNTQHYVFINGLWVWPHPDPPSGNVRRIYVGTLASITTYDGGDANAAGDASGPMWERDTTFDARMPLGVGTLPLSGTVVAVTNTGGADEVTVVENNLPEHDHGMPAGDNEIRTAVDPGSGNNNDDAVSGGGFVSYDTFLPFGQATPDPMDNMPPYIGCFFLKRSTRIYIRP